MRRIRRIPALLAMSAAAVLGVDAGSASTLAVNAASKYSGNFGLQVGVGTTNTNPAYVQDNSPLNEGEVRVRFMVHSRALDLAVDDEFDAYVMYNDADGNDTAGIPEVRVELTRPAAPGNDLQIKVYAKSGGVDVSAVGLTTALNIFDTPGNDGASFPGLWPFWRYGWRVVEIRWVRETGAATNDGRIELWVDGAVIGSLTNLDNFTGRIDYVQMGAVAGIDVVGVNKNLFYDDYVSQRANGIGPLNSVFTDVANPPANETWGSIHAVYHAGITGGVTASPPGTLQYGPSNNVTRAQMAIFLIRSKFGPNYLPPAATGTVFTDVAAGPSGSTSSFIEELFNKGITSGCSATPPGTLQYCPSNPVRRDAMAKFLLKMLDGAAYVPPDVASGFTDVASASGCAGGCLQDYIDAMAAYTPAITAGCSGTPGNFQYCPANNVTRAQMALFLKRGLALPVLIDAP